MLEPSRYQHRTKNGPIWDRLLVYRHSMLRIVPARLTKNKHTEQHYVEKKSYLCKRYVILKRIARKGALNCA